MAVMELRVCDRHLPQRVPATGKPWTLQVGEIKLRYDLCAPCREEMDEAAREALMAVRSMARRTKTKRVAAKRTRAKVTKAVRARKTVAVAKPKRGAKFPCRYEGCTEGPFKSGQARGQHERFTHNGALSSRKNAKTKVSRATRRAKTARKKVAAAKR